ncbi:DNA cytosine methyltransferase [Vibrio aestuarianus]|uniref:DNA cytosine methyltransferase n=1 Tax=Vibrio aestuarianus TaxID=28171 RepID=UPI001594949B|nr:DNA cytosine methyltransferase [Vibrio aestuarianus]MDE1235794.1 DNA cytosine methyltransferase [Vibrio aestuarianus]MDE1246650.1 DNA cytosine methyltransferase [Vibrio aestuarianus]MDE1316330.1 DNA cytosine methyltransferase [Vibrio aestuarianus]NGZ63787.1 DNA cytosine methyltransferase [Vibrio aestuarianus subsp. cardii]
MILPGEIVVDNFAGGGGASTGMELGLNRHVDIAINHDKDAIDMHKMNHPETKHYCESVWDVDPIEACSGRPVGLAWFSPDCKHFSKAKGNRPVNKNIRGLAWVVVRWAALVPVRVFMLENVEEFKTWGPLVEVSPGKFKPCPERKGETFNAFISALTTGLERSHPAWEEIKLTLGSEFPYHKLEKGLGYNIEHRVISACDYGVPTTRKRFFLVARKDNQPINWPEVTHGEKGSGLIPYKTAADIIDWSIPVKSIFGRKKPLVENTMKRIAKGLEKFVLNNDNPFIAPSECTVPFITEHANASNQRNMPADEPLRTICAQVKGGHFALVTAFMTKFRAGSVGYEIDSPVHTITSGGEQKRPGTANTQAVVTSHMVKLRGTNIGHGTDEPVHTISAGGLHIGEVRAFLLKYYGTSFGEPINTPLGTVTTKDRFGLVTVHGEQYQIIDIGMRMLEPHELFAAHDFPTDYAISHTSKGKKRSKADQVARVGNSVPPTMARVLVEANLQIKTLTVAA